MYDMGNKKTKVRIALQWIYSRVKLLEDVLVMLDKQLREDQADLVERLDNYKTMTDPFADVMQASMNSLRYSTEHSKPVEFNLEITDQEQQLAKRVDKVLKYSPIQYAKFTYVMSGIFAVLVCLTSLARADSMNVTVSALSIYLLFNSKDGENNKVAAKKSEKAFRGLCAGLVVSAIYDIVWHVMRDSAEGQNEMGNIVVEVASWLQVVAVLFKVVMCFVFWKASLGYAAVID